MFIVQNLMKVFLAVLFITVASVLYTTDVEARHFVKKGTRVDVGAHADFLSGASLRLVVVYLNPSSNPIEIKEIKIFGLDGTLQTPIFPVAGFPNPPFELGPFESKGFALQAAGIIPASFPPSGWFQVQASWKSKRATTSLKSWSVIISSDPSGEETRTSQEGFDLRGKKPKDD